MFNLIDIQKQMANLDDASLRRLVILERSDYLPEAVEVARGEFARRGMALLTPEEYWEQHQDEWLNSIGFCYSCWAETLDGPTEHSVQLNFIGTRLLGKEDPCNVCGSVVQTMYFCVVVPLVPGNRYRVIRGKKGNYIARKMKPIDSPKN